MFNTETNLRNPFDYNIENNNTIPPYELKLI